MKVLFAGGGTGGHINPALAIAKTIKSKNKDAKILFVGNETSIEQKLVENAGFDIKFIKVSGFLRKLTFKNIKTFINYEKSKKMCKKIISDFKPDIVIGTGGYVSAPVLKCAQNMGIKTVIHEQNAFPGMTTKMLSKKADKIFISFKSSKKYFEDKNKIILSGNPLNPDFIFTNRSMARKKLGLCDDDFYVLSFAGILGAREINKVMASLLVKAQKEKKFKILHAVGSFGMKWMPEKLKENGFDENDKSAKISEFIYDMPIQMAASDLIIARAGAITLGEITAMGKPSIIIPSPNVTNNHQYHNAKSLFDNNACIMIEEKDMSADVVYNQVINLINDKKRLDEIGKNAQQMALLEATEIIYHNVFDMLK